MPKKPDPRSKLARATALRADADAVEAEAIRDALEASDWLVSTAATLLGYPRHTTLVRLLETRHAAIGEELKQRRAEHGYGRGNPATMRK